MIFTDFQKRPKVSKHDRLALQNKIFFILSMVILALSDRIPSSQIMRIYETIIFWENTKYFISAKMTLPWLLFVD
jgi:hypothetical protein